MPCCSREDHADAVDLCLLPLGNTCTVPYFVFNVPEVGLEGGPLRPHATGRTPPIVNGSMTIDLFERIFDDLWDAVEAHRLKSRLPLAPPQPATATALTPGVNPAATLSAAAASASATSDDAAAVLGELARRGGDVTALLALARAEPATQSTALHATLKTLGYAKIGKRLKVAATLAAAESAARRDGGADKASRSPAAAGPLSGRRVCICGLSARPELNGRVGTCGRYDAAKGRYAVRLMDSQDPPLSIKPVNLAEEAAAKDERVAVLAKEDEEEEELVMF